MASFRPIEILDIRDLDEVNHPNISFVQADLMQISSGRGISTDSISCLHAIEHFGLGRYGDPIDTEGHLKGFRNIVNMLDPGGMLYISFPIGRKNEVHFNAHRVFHPHDIFSWPIDDGELSLERFDYVDDQGGLHRIHPLEEDTPDVQYGCGIYSFRKSGKIVVGEGE